MSGQWRINDSPLQRVASFLRNRLHSLYGEGWSGKMEAAMSEPRWLKAIWRWCGLCFIGFDVIKLPYIASCYTKKVVQDPDGSWWCETTYTPPECYKMDIRKLVAENPLRDLMTPEDESFFQMAVKQTAE